MRQTDWRCRLTALQTAPAAPIARMALFAALLVLALFAPAAFCLRDDVAMTNALPAMPAGYHLQFYDDCGIDGRQPHVHCESVYTYPSSQVPGDDKARTVAVGTRKITAVYDGLRPDLGYVLAITYANEAFNNRVQSLWAGKVEIHGPHALPKGGSERLLFRVPREAVAGGRLELEFRLEAQVNVVVSAIELWADAPARRVLHLDPMTALIGDLGGRVLDTAWDPVAGAKVALRGAKGGGRPLAEATSDADGRFSFARKTFADLKPAVDLEVVADADGLTARRTVAAHDLSYSPLRYRPIPLTEPGIETAQRSLDGNDWRLDPTPGKDTLTSPLSSAAWHPFHVPGQFVEEGYDVPTDKPVALAREFTVPADWAGRRVILRFDAIHAGTRYFVNGRLVGESQNLFTPVELDITDAVRPGATNRLDLEMTVDTLAERMSDASGYAFHSLGGVLRAVHLFALPQVHLRDLRVFEDLDAHYRDATLTLRLAVQNSGGAEARGLGVGLRLEDPEGAPVSLGGAASTQVAPLAPGERTVAITAHVSDPAKWSAEKPALYRLVIDLKDGPRLLERVDRRIGFRKIEARDGQLYVNGVRVKLAGACHHETDPLTGRADTMRHAEQDVRLLKEANLNYIRTSHYPPTRELLDAADRIGMYVEVEAPFCWVGDDNDASHLRTVLDPTSAMVDYDGAHPSVTIWSLANESQFNWLFEQSEKLVKALDPTRPTTFNNPDPKRLCDIANVHYPGMPYDKTLPGDPRPILIDEYDFPVCHEQTDVGIDPGLRELWGAGHSEPDSAWGKECAKSFEHYSGPGTPPGTWSYIVHSHRIIGGAIWAALDDAFYLPDGRHVGYAWHHGFWGLIDEWRRPKPEWWLAKLIFSPVWFPTRHFSWAPGETSLRVPVDNRYSFTDLDELTFTWDYDGRTGHVAAKVAPGEAGDLALPVPPGFREGDSVILRVTDSRGELINVVGLQLGTRKPRPLPAPSAGAPRCTEDGTKVVIDGDGWSLVLDKTTGQLVPSDPREKAAVIAFPSPHVTRFDFGDLVPSAPPYEVLPDAATRVVDGVDVREVPGGLEMAVRDHYKDFAGTMTWVIDRAGVGRVTSDYVYTGADLNAREVGVRFLLRPGCDTLAWKRWSEWAVYPPDSISRTEGVAQAHRDPALGKGAGEGTVGDPRIAPNWPYALDETALGTNDFRGVKLNIYRASLTSPEGDGLRVYAHADRHVRACLDPRGVWLHILTDCHLGPVVIRKGERLRAEYSVKLLPKR